MLHFNERALELSIMDLFQQEERCLASGRYIFVPS